MTEQIDILSLEPTALAALLEGEPKYRVEQVFSWLHEKRVTHCAHMNNLPLALRYQLYRSCTITQITPLQTLRSAQDGTVKFLYRLPDGNCIESVFMKYQHGNTLCVSTQVGCRMGCRFCASTLGGLVRGLTAGEMLSQVYETVRQLGERVDGVVLMGIGEPLDNYENVITFLRLLTHPKGYNLGQRHISLSTCGLVPGIERLMQEDLQITLSISLHGVDNESRGATMPINDKYPIEELMAVCKKYFAHTGRRISFEYALIQGVNDTPRQAEKLAALLRGMPCHLNLIPVNPVAERGYRRTDKAGIQRFTQQLIARGINATVRRELGKDINAACGQLRRQQEEGERECE